MANEDLEAEAAYIERAYQELERMRRRAQELLGSMKGADPDLEWALARRVRALADQPRALCFGRIDSRHGETWYVGRRHVEDEGGDPVVVEWRAAVAVPYYRASHSEPLGLVRRRQFVVEGPRLLSIGDDLFDGTGAAGRPRGEEALLVELERARTGEMLDIVATIQPEQDEVIRAPAPGVLAVQGGPGSGKTAVGLHRAAFLLYSDDAMARANVLVVGPGRTFLRYIAQVLPSLGEQAVVQTTLVDLVPEVSGAPGRGDDPAAERLKGDARLAQVLARALEARRGKQGGDLAVSVGVRRVVLAGAEVDATAERVAGRGLPYAVGREVLRTQLLARLAGRWAELTGSVPPDGAAFERAVRADAGFKAAIDARWPSVAPASLVGELLTRPALLDAASEGILDPAERRLLLRRRARDWTPADAAVVDEAKDLIAGQSRTYGHVIADEAQDLSPMQLRMLARRCPDGSMTLLGDLAQAVGPWAHRDWRELGAWLPTHGGLRVVELRHGYRSPGQVLELAGRLLPEAAPDVTPTIAVRPGRSSPRRVAVTGEIGAAVAAEAARLAREWPTVGVVGPTALLGVLGAALPGAGLGELGKAVTVLAAVDAKGLEFDSVIVVEPAAIVAERTERAAGLRLLYVALTRPTQHLSIVSAGPLPAAIAA